MKKLFIFSFVGIASVVSASDMSSTSNSNKLITITQNCNYYAEGVKANLSDKNVKEVTMTYSANYSAFAKTCKSAINELLPNLKVEPKLVTNDTMPTVSYTSKNQ
jgi:transposase